MLVLQCGPRQRSPPTIVEKAENHDKDGVERVLKENKDSLDERSCVRTECGTWNVLQITLYI